MPSFQKVPVDEARQRATSGPQARMLEQYRSYIERLKPGLAGKLAPEPGETVAMLRRRLGRAARTAGVPLVMQRTGDAVYFWKAERRRRRKNGS